MVCKIIFCFEFPVIPDKVGRNARRRRTQAIAKRYMIHANGVTFAMPYHGLIAYFKLKRFTWLDISTSVINTIR